MANLWRIRRCGVLAEKRTSFQLSAILEMHSRSKWRLMSSCDGSAVKQRLNLLPSLWLIDLTWHRMTNSCIRRKVLKATFMNAWNILGWVSPIWIIHIMPSVLRYALASGRRWFVRLQNSRLVSTPCCCCHLLVSFPYSNIFFVGDQSCSANIWCFARSDCSYFIALLYLF